MDPITVEQAIKKGNRSITYPTLFIFFGLVILTLVLGLQDGIPVWVYPFGFVLSFTFAWIYWSVRITKWKVWAFDHVRNVHELHKRAIEANLIYNEHSVLNKTEIWSTEDKLKWNALQIKFETKDEFVVEDDFTIPQETIIFYSKGKNYVEMLFMICFAGLGLFLLFLTDSWILGLIFSILGAYLSYKEFKQATNTDPQIILNEHGIQTVSTQIIKWSEIENEDVVIHGSGQHVQHYLTYDYPHGSEFLAIDDFEINYLELRRLLKIYKSRSLNFNQPR